MQGLLALAVQAEDAALAARLYLLGARALDEYKRPLDVSFRQGGPVLCGRLPAVSTRREDALGVELRLQPSLATGAAARRFVARAVVRSLLRRYVRAWLVMWYWREAAAKGKYAAPNTAAFEDDMEAPVFSEGALGDTSD